MSLKTHSTPLGVAMARQARGESKPMQALRRVALGYPEAQEGTTCTKCAFKALLREARPYAEGRGIRFPATSAADVAAVLDRVALKTAPG